MYFQKGETGLLGRIYGETSVELLKGLQRPLGLKPMRRDFCRNVSGIVSSGKPLEMGK